MRIGTGILEIRCAHWSDLSWAIAIRISCEDVERKKSWNEIVKQSTITTP
jgi:hypothetical protein